MKITPTLVTSCTVLPPEGANFPRGGPSENPAYTHNGQNISADAFYAIACDPRRSVAVEACAGAGKTWMLVSRMVRALLDGQTKPHEILAITFTKKAAGEMRERLYEWLAQFAQADDETLEKELVHRGVLRGFEGQNSLQANDYGRKQLSNLYAHVLSNGRPVQIRTFHSWFAALLRTAPMATLQQLGLPINYELLEDDAQAKVLVWRRFYAALLTLPALKADFENVVLAHGRHQAGVALQGALDKRTEFLLADAAGVVDTSVQHFTVQFPEFAGLARPEEALGTGAARELLLSAAKALGQATAPTFSAKGVELEAALADGNAAGVLVSLLTDKGTPRKFGEKIIGIATVRKAQDLALRITEATTQHDAWDYQQRMARLSRLLLTEFAALKRERGWVDMNDVERAAHTMLSDEVLSGWVQERLDANIRHLMIDEFQDTNPLQWQALSSWLSGYAGAAKAPSVFIVGDPKQSIYRFRRAEPQVFIAAQAFMRDALGGDVLACDHTRRSSQAVIATVNAAMGAAHVNDGYEGFRAHTSASADAGSVYRLPPILRPEKSPEHEVFEWRDSLATPRELPEETLRTLEARQAASWIQNQIAREMTPTLVASRIALPPEGAHFSLGRPGGKILQPSDIMVLSRKRASLLPLQQELRALNIPAQVGEKTELIDCCEVLDVVALLDVLVSPQHDLSLARALRSPLFCLSDDALVQIVLAKTNVTQSWFDVLQNKALTAPELIGLGAVLARYKGLVDALPPHDALQAIYDQGDVLARFGAAAPAASRAAVLSNLRALLTAALQLNGGRYATPYAFVRALKAGGLQAPAAVLSNAVRLLTIHGAKGLEADAVLLLDTDTAERNAASMSVLVDWPGQALAPHKFVFLISESKPPACAQATLAAEKTARQREELNALYVAMTRAKNTLAVSSIEPYREAPGSWWQRLRELSSQVPVEKHVSVDESVEPVEFALPDLPAFTPADKPALAVLALELPSARIGKAMHRFLEWGDTSALTASRVAREFGLSPEQLQDAQSKAQRIKTGAAAWAWDAAVIAWQGNEVELTHEGETFRLDRLVQRKDAAHAGHWWVLDYKSAAHPQAQANLVAKMQTYKAALLAIYPNQVVKAAFLTADGAVIEVA